MSVWIIRNVFGGTGVGFCFDNFRICTSRGSIKGQYSKNWKTQSYLNVKKPISPFGVNGHVFFANMRIIQLGIQFGCPGCN
ncbi:hypothetical protein ACFFWB_07685 [Flavobacterium procerum]